MIVLYFILILAIFFFSLLYLITFQYIWLHSVLFICYINCVALHYLCPFFHHRGSNCLWLGTNVKKRNNNDLYINCNFKCLTILSLLSFFCHSFYHVYSITYCDKYRINNMLQSVLKFDRYINDFY